jgi:hypothetical protein
LAFREKERRTDISLPENGNKIDQFVLLVSDGYNSDNYYNAYIQYERGH